MHALTFQQALDAVVREVTGARSTYRAATVREPVPNPPAESIALSDADARVLAEDVHADRDYPPFDRSARDGFALRAIDLTGRPRIVGEVRAGTTWTGTVQPGEAVEIMTGAPVPDGADTVVMVEHCTRHGDGTISIDRSPEPGANIVARGSEAAADSIVLTKGTRLDYTSIACLASVGKSSVSVFARPEVAVLSTGDEIVEVAESPAPHQIRNSNAWALAAQVRRAGGIPKVLNIARDNRQSTRALIEEGLKSDMLLMSGGVSAGKYDVVEPVLAELDAEFFFTKVLIQPGAPLVFGRARNKFFFGLPGNPASTMVTFELFGRTALQILSGENIAPLALPTARLTRDFRHRSGLTRFLPAEVRGSEVTPINWKGSGDVGSLCRANAFMVVDADKPEYSAGEPIPILFK